MFISKENNNKTSSPNTQASLTILRGEGGGRREEGEGEGREGAEKGEESKARTCEDLRIPGIDSKESITPAYVAWRAGTSNRVVIPARHAGNRFLGALKGLQIRALASRYVK